MTYVISVSNVKGGVAKTSTVVSLGSSLAQAGHRVLVIDLDAQADLTLGLDLRPGASHYSAKDLFTPGLLKKDPLSSFIVRTKYDHLDLIASNGEIGWGEAELPAGRGLENTLREVFRSEPARQYDFILIDCPTSMDVYTISALMAADLLLIPTQAEYFSANSLKKMISVFQTIRQKGNTGLEYRVLVTMLDLRNRVQRQVLDEFQKGFKAKLFASQIEIDTKIKESQFLRVPLIHSFPLTRAAIQYQDLSKEIIEALPKLAPQQSESPVSIPIPEPVVERRIHAHCPFLGQIEDETTALRFASESNCCYRAEPNAIPKLEYQRTSCLTSNYTGCVLLRENPVSSLPAQFQEHPPAPSIWKKLGF
jgi:chromosome partitioning protein